MTTINMIPTIKYMNTEYATPATGSLSGLRIIIADTENGTIRRVPYISVTGTKLVCLQFRSFPEKELCEPIPPSVIFYKKSYLFR